ncbi:MAG: ATP-dependent DNA helicase [Thermodesulfobacteriota bacterium]
MRFFYEIQILVRVDRHYLTARTTGRLAAEEALEEIRRRGGRIRSVTLTAKEKICPNPGRACLAEECALAHGYYDRINAAVLDLFETEALDREALARGAEKHMVCPFELSLELALWTDFLIGDYNYAFDPRVSLKRFFQNGGAAPVLLIDEAHNLPDRARRMFSAGLSKRAFLELRREMKDEWPEVYRKLGKVNSAFLALGKRVRESGGRLAEKEKPSDLCTLLEDFVETVQGEPGRVATPEKRETLWATFFEALALVRIGEGFDHNYATLTDTTGGDVAVKLACLDPAQKMEKALERGGAAVFFSGTLSPLEYYKEILGCGPSAETLILPSPFPPENLKVLIADNLSTLYRRRGETRFQVAEAVRRLVESRQGNYLVFFPSYRYLDMVAEVLAGRLESARLVAQTPGMTEARREEFLAGFSSENEDTLVGLAVMGGIFGEGIDLAGDRLNGAVIVGLGLPGIDFEREVLREHIQSSGRGGFEYAYLYPGLTRVLQAAGRVIRSEKDRGVLLLIDPRFNTPEYLALLPGEWTPVVVRSGEEVSAALEEFWGERFVSTFG